MCTSAVLNILCRTWVNTDRKMWKRFSHTLSGHWVKPPQNVAAAEGNGSLTQESNYAGELGPGLAELK